MTRIKVIYAMGNPIFLYKEANDIGYSNDEILNKVLDDNKYHHEMELLMEYLQYSTKADILLTFEYLFLRLIDKEFFARYELDSNIVQSYVVDVLCDDLLANSTHPTYISEYISIIGQLFLAGYIDFGCDWDDDYERIDYPTNLSYYKDDMYQSWVYFRDKFFYANAFSKYHEDDILIYEDKEYTTKDCPSYINKEGESIFCGYSTMYSPTSWDTPKYWSQYNIWVARTPKGDKYFNEILAPRFYNKYKDLEVEIDSKGNIVRWIGNINR